MASPTANRIRAQIKRLATLDVRIGKLMDKRVTQEEKLAALYERYNQENSK